MMFGEKGFDWFDTRRLGFHGTGLPASDSYGFSSNLQTIYTKKASSFDEAFEWWSVKRDSNPRPSGPKPDALPSCAIHRQCFITSQLVRGSKCYQNKWGG